MGAQQLVRCALVWLICAFSGRWEHVTGEVVHMEQRGEGGGYHTAESWQRAQKLIHKHAHTFVPSIDENKDGKMSLPEVYQHLAIVMRRQHQGLDGALRSEFGEVDADGSNGVSLEEYQKYEVFEATENTEFGWKVTTDVHQRNIDKYAQAMFALLDLNDDGQLNADEFEGRSGIDGDIMQLMHVADADGDSHISHSEIVGSAGRVPAHLEHFLAYDEL